MATDVTTLRSRWAMRVGTFGDVLQDVEEIEQEMRVVVRTQKRSVPYARDFGVDWLSVVDLPIIEAVPKLVLEVTEALRRWVARARIVNVEMLGTYDAPRLRVTWLPPGADGALVTELSR